MAEKYEWKCNIFRNVTGYNDFSKVSCIRKLILQENFDRHVQKYEIFG